MARSILGSKAMASAGGKSRARGATGPAAETILREPSTNDGDGAVTEGAPAATRNGSGRAEDCLVFGKTVLLNPRLPGFWALAGRKSVAVSGCVLTTNRARIFWKRSANGIVISP
jgi:hypothetical protein